MAAVKEVSDKQSLSVGQGESGDGCVKEGLLPYNGGGGWWRVTCIGSVLFGNKIPQDVLGGGRERG